MKYPNKIDPWIRILLYLLVFMYLPIMLFVPTNEIYMLGITFLLSAVIILPLLYGYVELSDDYVVIQMHLFRKKIAYDDIRSLRLCENWLSSMSLTRKRIEIKEWNKGYIRGTTFIGPVHREEVLQELQYRCHKLESNVQDN